MARFTAGMKNVVEALNEMWAAFAAGPFNALPLTGGTLTGPLAAPQFRGAMTGERQASGGFVVGGDQGGWWRIAKFSPAAIASTANIRILGATPFNQFVGGNGMDLTISLRCDANGVIRGHFYAIGGPANTAPLAVSVGLEGDVYVQLYALSTVEIYTDSTMSLPSLIAYTPNGPPADAIALSAMFGVKCGNESTLTVTPGTIRANASITAGAVLPLVDNTHSVGSSALAYSTIYARTGAINTSDARLKTDFRDLTPAEIAAGRDIARAIGIYRWRDAVEEKGEAAREHVGPTVQRAIEIMQAHGLDPFNYGFICHDAWEQQTVDHPAVEARPAVPTTDAMREVRDESGVVVTPAVPASPGYPAVEARAAYTEVTVEAGDRYAFRYDELAMFIAAGQEARLAALEAAA